MKARVLLIAVALGTGVLAGGAIGLSAAVGRDTGKGSKRCHPRKHHRCASKIKRCHQRKHHHCPVALKTPGKHHGGKPGAGTTTTTTGTTTTTTTGTTTATTPLPSRLEVDENDGGAPSAPYSLNPSHNPVAAGNVQFNIYNFGQDDHTFAIRDSSGHQIPIVDSSEKQLEFANLPAGQNQTAVTVSANLAPGTYTLYCTLSGHEQNGMVGKLTVR